MQRLSLADAKLSLCALMAFVLWVTSGGYGHCVDQSLAQGYIPTALVKPGMQLEIEILGERCPARLQMEPPFDPEAKRMRM